MADPYYCCGSPSVCLEIQLGNCDGDVGSEATGFTDQDADGGEGSVASGLSSEEGAA